MEREQKRSIIIIFFSFESSSSQTFQLPLTFLGPAGFNLILEQVPWLRNALFPQLMRLEPHNRTPLDPSEVQGQKDPSQRLKGQELIDIRHVHFLRKRPRRH